MDPKWTQRNMYAHYNKKERFLQQLCN